MDGATLGGQEVWMEPHEVDRKCGWSHTRWTGSVDGDFLDGGTDEMEEPMEIGRRGSEKE